MHCFEDAQHLGKAGLCPVKMGAHGARAVAVGFMHGTLHAAGSVRSRPFCAVLPHERDGLEQVAIYSAHFIHHIGLVDVDMDIHQTGQQRA